MRDSPTKKALPAAEEEWPHTERAEHLSQYHITPVQVWNYVNNNGTQKWEIAPHFTFLSVSLSVSGSCGNLSETRVQLLKHYYF